MPLFYATEKYANHIFGEEFLSRLTGLLNIGDDRAVGKRSSNLLLKLLLEIF